QVIEHPDPIRDMGTDCIPASHDPYVVDCTRSRTVVDVGMPELVVEPLDHSLIHRLRHELPTYDLHVLLRHGPAQYPALSVGSRHGVGTSERVTRRGWLGGASIS